MKLKLLVLFSCALLLLAPVAIAWDDHDDHDEPCTQVVGFVSATLSQDVGFEGLWRYCVTVDFDRYDEVLDAGGFELYLPFDENCPCICHPDLIKFGNPAGHVSGYDWWSHSSTNCNYYGFYHCEGDTAAPDPFDNPSISFELSTEDEHCDSDDIGRATLCFYSALPPGPYGSWPVGMADDLDDDDHDGDYHDWNDENDGSCQGLLTGRLPACDCSVPTLPTSWGRVKSRFED